MAASSGGVLGQRTVVIGASSGIGRVLADALVARGAHVVVSARRSERLAEIEGAHPIACDVTRDEDVDALIEGAVAHLGGLDAIVYVTGLTKLHSLEEARQAEWLEIFATNVFGAASVARAAMPHLLDQRSQHRALFVSSVSADGPYPGLVLYGSSKMALRGFTQGLAAEVPGLRVTEVVVGPTSGTEVYSGLDPELHKKWTPLWHERGMIPYRMIPAEEVADMIVEVLAAEAPPLSILAAGPIEEPTAARPTGG